MPVFQIKNNFFEILLIKAIKFECLLNEQQFPKTTFQ